MELKNCCLSPGLVIPTRRVRVLVPPSAPKAHPHRTEAWADPGLAFSPGCPGNQRHQERSAVAQTAEVGEGLGAEEERGAFVPRPPQQPCVPVGRLEPLGLLLGPGAGWEPSTG